MFSFTEQISAATKSQIETQFKILNAFASKTFEGAQQVIALNLSATKASVDKTSAAARQLLEAKDPREFFTASAAQAPNLENVLAYSRELFSIASKTQAELVQSAREQLKEATATAAGARPLTLVPASAPVPVATAPVATPAPAPAAPAPAPVPEPAAAAPAPVPAPAAAAPAVAVEAASAPAEPADVVAAPPAAPKEAAKAEAKAKPATIAKPVAEAVAKVADKPAAAPAAKPAAAPIPETNTVVLKSVAPVNGTAKPAPTKQLDVQAGKPKK